MALLKLQNGNSPQPKLMKNPQRSIIEQLAHITGLALMLMSIIAVAGISLWIINLLLDALIIR